MKSCNAVNLKSTIRLGDVLNRTNRIATRILVSVLSVLSVVSASAQEAKSNGYLGARLVENTSGQTVFSWFFPGPMNGSGLSSGAFDVQRPDVLVSIDGTAMNASEADAYLAERGAGAEVTIIYEPAKQRGTANIPVEVETTGKQKSFTVTLDDRDAFVGTIGRPRTIDREWTRPEGERLLDPNDSANILGEALAAHGLREEVEKLEGVFKQWLERTDDTHMLSRVRAPFLDPFALPELERDITGEARGITSDLLPTIRKMIQNNLDLDEPRGSGMIGSGNSGLDPYQAGSMLWMNGTTARFWAEKSLGNLANDADFAHRALNLLRVPRRTFYIGGDSAKEHIGVINASINVDFDLLLLGVLDKMQPILDAADADLAPDPQLPLINPPAGLGVTGRIIAASDPGTGWIVIGSTDNNTYDMSKIAMVIDPGGNDTYTNSDLAIGNRLIIDLAGNDRYTGNANQSVGGALLGSFIIDDRAGDDRYEGELLGPASALYGLSILIDRAGNDIYTGKEWSLGAACYGAALLIDLGGSDVYIGEYLCQGVGGPRGFGAIIDASGNDLYRTNGPQPSAYGTPAVYQSFSQGMGFGFRNYAAGGVGLISDLAGNDRYEAGEFAQGGAYYFALGILHDASGDDLYYGNRYGQGFGVHQAHGALADDAGNDTYWSMTAASQGAAWDIGAGLLIDRAGDDTYRCDGLGQGGASMQAIAMFIDLGGRDHYTAGGGATQGESGGDSYHFAATGAFSFSLLMDLGGAEDVYSRGRANNETTKTGSVNEEKPENSSAWGLVIDR